MGICPNCGSLVDKGGICRSCEGVSGYDDDYSEEDILSMFNNAERERKKGNLKASIEIYERIIKSFDNNLDPYYYDSFASYHIRDAKKAIEEMKAQSPIMEEVRTISDEAWSLYDKGYLEEALDSINLAIETYPHIANNYNIKAIILDNMGRYEEASYFYDKALSLNANDNFFLKNKAIMLSRWAAILLENSKVMDNGLDMLNDAYEKIKTAIEILPENNNVNLDSLKQQKKSIEFYVELENDFQKKLETIELYEKDMLFTITGMDFHEMT